MEELTPLPRINPVLDPSWKRVMQMISRYEAPIKGREHNDVSYKPQTNLRPIPKFVKKQFQFILDRFGFMLPDETKILLEEMIRTGYWIRPLPYGLNDNIKRKRQSKPKTQPTPQSDIYQPAIPIQEFRRVLPPLWGTIRYNLL